MPRLLRLALLVKQPRPRIPDKIPSACATGVPLLGSFHKSFLHRIFLNVGRDKSRLPRRFDECGFAGQHEKRYGARAFQFANAIRFRGHSFQQEALRFGELGDRAPKVDLSSYLMQFQTGKMKYQSGHYSYGTLRHLMNGFCSRGLMMSFPVGKQGDFSLTA